jgi:hypothetical protein
MVLSLVAPSVSLGPLRSAPAFFPGLPEALHRRSARDSVLSEAASDAIDLVGPSERRVRHADKLPAESLQLRFVQPIEVRGGHHRIISCSPFVRLL